MTKKDYEKIAKVFSEHDAMNPTEQAYRNDLIEAMAFMLFKDNPKFNKTLFLEACRP